jgi:magnesium-transporting ATPase (P-type)
VNTVPDKSKNERTVNQLFIAIMVFAVVICFLPFFIAYFTNTRMF